MAKTAFTGGKLSFKGDKKKAKKKSKRSKHLLEELDEGDVPVKASAGSSEPADAGRDSDDEDLTAAERRARKFIRERERKEMEQVVKYSHRQRVEQFNEKLGKLTEHNDIPRVSAAGNG